MKIKKIHTILLFTLFLICGCAEYDARLEGKWKSNKEETVKRYKKESPQAKTRSPENLKKFFDLFGKMVIVYDKNKFTTDINGQKLEGEYKVIEKGEDYVIISSLFDLEFMNEAIKSKIIFVEDGYWDETDIVKEKFNKIK
jgi:hypothetical protein